jgi:cytochrome b561
MFSARGKRRTFVKFQTAEKYALIIRVLHWLMAAVIIGLLVAGFIMLDVPKTDPLRHTVYSLHKSLGITILMLAVLRLGLRLKSRAPVLPEAISALHRRLAHVGHWALYGLMLLMPVSGYVMSISNGQPVKWFGSALPRLLNENKTRGAMAGDIHAYAAYILIGMLVLHAGAVIWHYLFERVNLLRRMM